MAPQNRRSFLKTGISAITGMLIPYRKHIHNSNRNQGAFNPLRFGICTDLHHDLIFDSHKRLGAFINAMNESNVDFIIQLGDFCFTQSHNRSILDLWNTFDGPSYHVIGNHDLEFSSSIEEVINFYGMEAAFYSFDFNGYHIIVLNGNDYNPNRTVPEYFNRFIGDEQLSWLEKTLAETDLPTLVFTHQGLDNSIGGVENGQRIRIALEEANRLAGFRKVLMVFSGHHHKDYHNVINGIHLIQINSMSYHWQGDRFADQHAFSEDLFMQYPRLRNMAFYKEPLWAVVEITAEGLCTIQGRSSDFVGRSPAELGMPKRLHDYPVVPCISDRRIQLSLKPFTQNIPK